MIKGVNKSIIEVNDTGSKYFEKAILFIRPQYAEKGINFESKAKEYIAGAGSLKSGLATCYAEKKTLKKRRICLFLSSACAVVVAFVLCRLFI